MTKQSKAANRLRKMGRPFLRFMHTEASGGIVLLVCTLVALLFANSRWADAYLSFWSLPITLSFGELTLRLSLAHWINDGLMTIFFFLVGLEIKRELVTGELKEKRAALLPIIAALGGMIVPAVVYSFILENGDGSAGWGIPMATDIAFVVGFLSLFGKRVPHGLKIFILSLAIVDDLGAILVIAAVYSKGTAVGALALGLSGLVVTMLLNWMGVRRVPVYLFVGVFIWLCFLLSGVHPTIAGVMLGLLTPANAWIGDRAFLDILTQWQQSGRPGDGIGSVIFSAKETVSPLERFQINLHPWVAFVIMPVFALANAGVPLALGAVTTPISTAVVAGFVLGKPMGIFLFSVLAVRLLGARLPLHVNWRIILGSGFLCGVGFTMSIFIAGLALDGDHLVAGKVGTLVGSGLSAIFGTTLLFFVLPKKSNVL